MVVFAFTASNCVGKGVQNAQRPKIRRGRKSFRFFFLAGGKKFGDSGAKFVVVFAFSACNCAGKCVQNAQRRKSRRGQKSFRIFFLPGAKNSEISEPNLWSYSHSVRLTVLENAFKTPNDQKFDVAENVADFFWPGGGKKFGDSGAKFVVVFAFSVSNCAGKCVQNAQRRKIRRGQKSFRFFFWPGGQKIRRFRKPNLWSYSHSVRLTVLENGFKTPNDQKFDVAKKVSEFFFGGLGRQKIRRFRSQICGRIRIQRV